MKNHGDSSKEDQFDYLMNKSPRKHEWYSDPKDAVTAGWGLCLSAKDLALIETEDKVHGLPWIFVL